jgi:protein SCO1
MDAGRGLAPRLLPTLAALLLMVGCQSGADADFTVAPVQPAPALEAAHASGEPFRLSELHGKVVLLSFGYTACPDVCPTTLSRLSSFYRRLGGQAQDVEVVFISVDPERDTAQRLEDYVHVFSPRFTALRLEGEALTRVLSAYRVTATKRYLDPQRYGGHDFTGELPYTVDHTGGYFVIDRRGALRLHIPYDAAPERLQASVERLLLEQTWP